MTANSVVPGTGIAYRDALAGVAITAGQSIYVDSAGLWQLTDANASSTTAGVGSSQIAVAMNPAAAGQPVRGGYTGQITPGATLVKGTTYYVSANPGGIAPAGDLASGWFVTRLFYAISTTVGQFDVSATGVQE